MSGITFLMTALHRRGVSSQLCMAAVVVNLVSFYAAFVLVVLASIALLWFHHAIQAWLLAPSSFSPWSPWLFPRERSGCSVSDNENHR